MELQSSAQIAQEGRHRSLWTFADESAAALAYDKAARAPLGADGNLNFNDPRGAERAQRPKSPGRTHGAFMWRLFLPGRSTTACRRLRIHVQRSAPWRCSRPSSHRSLRSARHPPLPRRRRPRADRRFVAGKRSYAPAFFGEPARSLPPRGAEKRAAGRTPRLVTAADTTLRPDRGGARRSYGVARRPRAASRRATATQR